MAEEKPPRRTPLSLTEKRELMWNFTEPGDPYDIRKSMIAKLPGEQKFMGPHLEMVCLLQAAEIERLCQFLEEFKMRFRENERVELDRHSYEIQIRELTDRLSEESNYRTEIQRLREFIRRQSAELEEMQGVRRYEGELERNYQESLSQVAELKQAHSRISLELRAAREQLVSFEDSRVREAEAERIQGERRIAAFAQLESKSRESLSRWDVERRQFQQRIASASDETRLANQRAHDSQEENRSLQRQIERLTIQAAKSLQLSHTISEYQNRFTLLAGEIERLNGVLRDKSRELKEEQARGRQVSQALRVRSQQLSQAEGKIHELQQSNQQLQRQHRETLASLSSLEQTKSLTQSYEASLQRLSIQVDRLNNVLRKKLNQLEEARRRNNEAEIKLKTLQSLERENADNKMRLAEVGKRMAENEREAAAGQQENERLNYSIKKLIEQLNGMELRFKNAQKEIENRQKTIDILSTQIDKQRQQRLSLNQKLTSLSNQNYAFREAVSRHEDSKRIYQSKMTQYVGEVRRLQESLEERDAEVGNLRSSKSQNQLRLRQVESITQNDQTYIEQLLGTNQQLQAQLTVIAQENQELKAILQQAEQKDDQRERQLIAKQFEEISRLNRLLAEKDGELQRVTTLIREIPPIQGLQDQLRKKELQLEQIQGQLKAVQDQLRAVQIALIEKEDVVQYYATDNQHYHAENDRLKNNLEEREARIERLENQIDRIGRVVSEQPSTGELGEEGGDARVRAEVELGMLRERYALLWEQHEGTLSKTRQLQEEMAKLHYQLDTPAKKERQQPQQTSVSQKRETLQPSLSGDSLEVDENLIRQLQLLRNRCVILSEEGERLKEVGSRRQEEVNRLQQQLQATQRQLGQQRSKQWRERSPSKPFQEEEDGYQHAYEDLLTRYNTLVSQHAHLKLELEQWSSTRQSEEIELKRKNQQIAQHYNKILIFSQEIQRLNGILANKEKEKQAIINDFKQKTERYENKIRQVTSTSMEPRRETPPADDRPLIIQENQRLRNKNLQLQQEKKDLESRSQQQLRFLQGKVQLLEKEIIRLNQILQVKVQECNSRQAQNRAARSEYEGKLALVGQELERLNGVLKLKVENYRILQMEYQRYQEDAFRRINDQTQELHQSRDEVLRLNSQLQDLHSREQHKTIQLQSFSEYEGKILEQSSEIDRLSRLLLASKQKIEQLQQKDGRQLVEIERLNNSLRLKVEESILHEGWERGRLAQKQSSAAELESRIREYESLSVRYRQLEEESSLNRQHLLQYEKRIKVLYEQFERLQKIITALKKDNQEKSASLNALIEKNRFLGGELDRISRINKKQSEELGGLRLSIAQDMSLQRRIQEHLALFVVLFAEIQSLRELAKAQQEELEEVRRQNITARLV